MKLINKRYSIALDWLGKIRSVCAILFKRHKRI